MKKRGFAAGKWNGFGGKVEVETIEENAKREMSEECGLEIKNMDRVGLIDFEFKDNPEIIQVHFFKVNEFAGEPTETEEMMPKWFHVDEIPFTQMWPDDLYWMPFFLKGRKFKGKFLFGENDAILEKELEEVAEI